MRTCVCGARWLIHANLSINRLRAAFTYGQLILFSDVGKTELMTGQAKLAADRTALDAGKAEVDKKLTLLNARIAAVEAREIAVAAREKVFA